MITTADSFAAINSRLRKDPIVALEIDGYPRLFTTKPVDIGTLQDVYIGDAGPVPHEIIPSNVLVEGDNIDTLSDWLQPGDVGNSGGGDPNALSPGYMVPGTPALWYSTPKYRFNNVFWYRRMGAHNDAVRFVMKFKLTIPSGDRSACRCVEWQIQQNAGGVVYNMAWQINFASNKYKTFTYTGVTGTGHWDDTGIAVDPADYDSDNQVDIETAFHRDAGTVTHEYIKINGVTHTVNITRTAINKIQHDYVEPAFQLDSQDGSPPPGFHVETENMDVIMYDGADVVVDPTFPAPPPNYQIPFNIPTGQRLAWSIPSTSSSYAAHLPFAGAAIGSVDGESAAGAHIEMWHGCGLCDWSTWVKWRGFSVPLLPADASIIGIYPVMDVLDEGDTDSQLAGALFDMDPNSVFPGETSLFGSGARDSNYHTVYGGTIGNDLSLVSDAAMYARFFKSVGDFNGDITVRNPRLAIYYTSVSEKIGNPWIKEIQGLSYDVNILEGVANIGDVTVTVLDDGRLITADMPHYTIEGKDCRLKQGFVGQNYADFLTLFTGKVDTIPSVDDDLCYAFTLKNPLLELKQLVYTVGDSGLPTDSKNPKTVLGNPIDILKSILLSYVGLSSTKVDTVLLDTYRDTYFAGLLFEFHLTGSVEAKSFIESQIMKPLGGYLRPTNLGVISAHFMLPQPGTAVSAFSLSKDNMVTIPTPAQSDLVNVVKFKFDSDGNNYQSESVVQSDTSVAKFGLVGDQTIESDGMRSGFQGFYLSKLTANAIFDRIGNKNPTFDIEVFWDPGCQIELGDYCDVSHALMPNRLTGVMGVVGAFFEVESVSFDFENFTATLTLVDASFLAGLGGFRIAPDAIDVWTAESDANKDRYMFISNSTGRYSDGVLGHPLA
jgi:hypothetical protein